MILFRSVMLALVYIAISGCSGSSSEPKKEDQSEEIIIEYSIVASAGEGGTITPTSVTVESGSSAEFTISEDAYFVFDSYESADCTSRIEENKIIFEDVSKDCHVNVFFKVDPSLSAPTGDITFPSNNLKAQSDTVEVVGTAFGEQKITSVLLNSLEMSIESQVFDSTNNLWQANWSGVIEVDKFEDTSYELTVNDEATLTYYDEQALTIQPFGHSVPKNFVVDENRGQLFGIGTNSELIKYDMNSKTTVTYPLPIEMAYSYLHYDDVNTKVYIIGTKFSYPNETDILLTEYDLNAQTQIELARINMEGDPDNSRYTTLKDITFDEVGSNFYMNVQDQLTDNTSKSYIYQINLVDKEFTQLIPGELPSGDVFDVAYIAAAETGLYYINNDFNDSLYFVDYSILNSVNISSDSSVWSQGLHLSDQTAVVVGYFGIAKVNVTNGETEVQDEDPTELYALEQIRKSYYGKTQNKLYFYDSSLDAILVEDLGTDERHLVMDNGRGTGKKLTVPRELALSKQEPVAYVANDSGFANKSLIKVNLENGDRTLIGDVHLQFNQGLRDLLLTKNEDALILIERESVSLLDLSTEEIETLSGEGVGTGAAFGNLGRADLNGDGGFLYVADYTQKAIITIDMKTGERSILSKLGTRGEGPELDGPTGLAFNSNKNVLYVISQRLGQVFEIDPASGNRKVLLETCLNEFGYDRINPDSGNIQNLYFDKDSDILYGTADSTFKYDTNSSDCKTSLDYGSPLDLGIDFKGRLLGADFRELTELQLEKSEEVIVSR